MKKLITTYIIALLTAYPLAGFSQTSLENDPAYLPIDQAIDLKTIHPEVNVNLPHFLLNDVLSGLNAITNSPELKDFDVADALKDVKQIRVVVIEAKKNDRSALDKAVKTLRSQLEEKWTAIVSVPEDNVGVYAMSDSSHETTSGLAILVYDHDDLVIGNIVGHVSIDKLMKLATRSGKLPKDFFKKLQGMGDPAKETKSGDSSSTGATSSGPKSPAEDSPAK